MHEREQQLRDARALHQAGRLREAAALYLRAGEVDDAGRALFQAGAFVETAQLLLRAARLPIAPPWNLRAVQSLDADAARRARAAARCLHRAGRLDDAVSLWLGLGMNDVAVQSLVEAGRHADAQRIEPSLIRDASASSLGSRSSSPDGAPPPTTSQLGLRAVAATSSRPAAESAPGEAHARALEQAGRIEEALSRWLQLGRPAEAARLARRLGRLDEARDLYLRADRPFEAGLLGMGRGDHEGAIQAFLRVAPDSSDYAEACVHLIAAHRRLGRYDFPFVRCVTPFLERTPADHQQVSALWDFAELAEQERDLETALGAIQTLGRTLRDNPRVEEARQRLEAGIRGSARDFARVVEENDAFRRSAAGNRSSSAHHALPDLPDLPDLPGLPPAPAGSPSSRPRLASPSQSAHPRLGTEPYASSPGVSPPVSEPRRRPPSTGEPQPAETCEMPAEALGDWNREATSHGVDGASNPHHPAPPVSQPPVAHSEPGAGPRTSPSFSSADTPPDERWKGLEAGSVLAGRYRFERKLGQGGMAVVFLAHDLELDEDVAVKIFTRPLDDEQMVKRFKQELSLSRKLVHPNIIRLYDIGSSAGLRYITMEVLEGRDLYAFCGKPRPIDEVLNYVAQAARGLHGAHRKGVVHRDVKPHNIFLCTDGVIKVMDFGIARQTRAEGVTVGNYVAGTPEYMSPEQISGFSSVGPSTDVYALGVVLYQLLTGRLPFTHTDMLPLLMMHLNNEPEPPVQHRVDLPPELNALILQLLAKSPDQRLPSAEAVAERLEAIRASLPRS